MLQAARSPDEGRLPAGLAIVALAGFVIALFGTYWDDAWHTEKGRDSFLAAPHIALYAGVALAGATLALWALGVIRRRGARGVLAQPALCLALLGVAIALGSAPVDNAWHLAFGRDAVVWSPPHMLGVAGNFAIAAGLYLELSRDGRALGRGGELIAAAAVLAVAAIPVLEYDTDVPQFDLVFYLPALGTGAAFALALVRARAADRWAATRVATVYGLLLAAIAAVLAIGGMPGPLVPLLFVPAAAIDVGIARRWPAPATAALFVVALYAAYVPYLNWLLAGPFIDLADVAVGIPLALAGALAAIALAGLGRAPRAAPPAAAAVAAIALAVALVSATPARAHDPGQGEEVMVADLVGRSDGERAVLEVRPEECAGVRPVRLIARRAGSEIEGALAPTGPCRFGGAVSLPDRGRWFVYAELSRRGDTAETWLPLRSGARETRREPARSVYVPPDVDASAAKTTVGVAVYALLSAVVLAIPLLARRMPPAAVNRDR